MTTQELNQKADKFVADYNGKYISILGNTIPQCFDLVVKWTDILEVPHFPGNPSPFPYLNAYQIYTDFGPYQATYFTRIENTPDFIPKKGDIAVWSGGKPGTGGAGHTAMATGAGTLDIFQAFSQNDPTGSRCVLKTYNYDYFLGVLRLKVSDTPMNPNITRKASYFDRIWNAYKPGANSDLATDQEVTDFIKWFQGNASKAGKWDETVKMAYGPNQDSNQVTPSGLYNKIQSQVVPPNTDQIKKDAYNLAINDSSTAVLKLKKP